MRHVRGVDAWFMPLTWHVAGFLMLPFLGSAPQFTWVSVRDHAVRYLVPFCAAVICYSALLHLVYSGGAGFAAGLTALLTSVAVASALVLKGSTGYLALWFLPALFATWLLLAAIDSRRGAVAAAIVAVACAAHLAVGDAPFAVKMWMPQGVLIALYILPLGLTLRLVAFRVAPLLPRRWFAGLCATAALACWWALAGHNIEVATLDLPTWRTPVPLLLDGVADIAVLLALLAWAPLLARIPFVSLIGRYSLVVYLAHPLLYKPVFAALEPLSLAQDRSTLQGWLVYWAIALSSAAAATALSVAAAVVVEHVSWLRQAVTPRDWADWQPWPRPQPSAQRAR